jgi:hypothetical protein
MFLNRKKKVVNGEGRVEDAEWLGCPVTVNTGERPLIWNDHCLSIMVVAEELNMTREAVRQIVTRNFNMRRVCTRMVPENLIQEQKLERKEICFVILDKIKDDDILRSVVPCNDSWLFQYNPETKRQLIR